MSVGCRNLVLGSKDSRSSFYKFADKATTEVISANVLWQEDHWVSDDPFQSLKRDITWIDLGKELYSRYWDCKNRIECRNHRNGGPLSEANAAHILNDVLKSSRLVPMSGDVHCLPPACLSVGSLLHEAGVCKPCVFANKNAKTCRNGRTCCFCHHPHKDRRKKRAACSGDTALQPKRLSEFDLVSIMRQCLCGATCMSGSDSLASTAVDGPRSSSWQEPWSSVIMSRSSNRIDAESSDTDDIADLLSYAMKHAGPVFEPRPDPAPRPEDPLTSDSLRFPIAEAIGCLDSSPCLLSEIPVLDDRSWYDTSISDLVNSLLPIGLSPVLPPTPLGGSPIREHYRMLDRQAR